jgi:hydroxymethylbilane synthase
VSSQRIAIGSRGSALALAQAHLVCGALERDGQTTRIVVVETDGDRRAPDTAWGEGAFVAAIEHALLEGHIDVAVHSAKDVPTGDDPRLRIGAYLPRADPRDALVVRTDAMERCLAELRPGTRVGTDSPRRTGFLLAHRPDLIVHPLHGNVDTRLRRLDMGETDALLLACAGLDRLALGARISERVAPEMMPPAPGQGAIAVQIRRDDATMLALVASIDDQRTRVTVEVERAFLEASGGGCRAPIGALATIVADELVLLGGHASPDGSSVSLGHRRGSVAVGHDLAVDLAEELLRDHAARRSSPHADQRGPGSGGRVLVTRPTERSAALLAALRSFGLDPVLVPTIAIASDLPGDDLVEAAASILRYDWVVVTSAYGARAILSAADRHLGGPGRPRWGAIGTGTSAILEDHGVAVDFRPSRRTGLAMASELPLDSGDRVLVIRGDLAATDLTDGLRARGAVVDSVIAYRTVQAPEASRGLLREAVVDGPIQAVVFTSGSSIRGLLSLAALEALDVTAIPAVCIGPETAGEATRAGFRVLAIAPSQDASALAEATADALTRQPQETS